MKIIINKFYIRHQGVLYKAGDILDLPATVAKQIIKNNANVTAYHEEVLTAEQQEKNQSPTKPIESDEMEEITLPEADVQTAVKGKKK